jgi:TPR repeat protein
VTLLKFIIVLALLGFVESATANEQAIVNACDQRALQNARRLAIEETPLKSQSRGLYLAYIDALGHGRDGIADPGDLKTLQESASKGNVLAEALIGNLYNADGFTHKFLDDYDFKLADSSIESTKHAAERGNALAQTDLGEIYLTGISHIHFVMGADIDLGLSWLEKGAAAGDLTADIVLAKFYLSGRPGEADYGLALKWLSHAVDGRDPRAERLLSQLYSAGVGVERDPVAANHWLVRARLDQAQ